MTFTPIGQTAQTQVGANPSAGGQPRGKAGSVTKRQDTSEIAVWLASHKASDLDAAAVSRAKLHGVELRVKTDLRFPSGPNGEYLPSYSVAVGCDIRGTDEQRASALADLKNFETPASIRTIEAWLAELSVLTAGRSRDGMDAAMTVTAYSSRLAQYPADVAREALLVNTWKWWPTWDELKTVCDAKAGPRRRMIYALQQPEPKPEPIRRPATQVERDEIAALVAKEFPLRSQEYRDRAVDEVLRGNCMSGDAGSAPKRMDGAA